MKRLSICLGLDFEDFSSLLINNEWFYVIDEDCSLECQVRKKFSDCIRCWSEALAADISFDLAASRSELFDLLTDALKTSQNEINNQIFDCINNIRSKIFPVIKSKENG